MYPYRLCRGRYLHTKIDKKAKKQALRENNKIKPEYIDFHHSAIIETGEMLIFGIVLDTGYFK